MTQNILQYSGEMALSFYINQGSVGRAKSLRVSTMSVSPMQLGSLMQVNQSVTTFGVGKRRKDEARHLLDGCANFFIGTPSNAKLVGYRLVAVRVSQFLSTVPPVTPCPKGLHVGGPPL